MRTPDGRHVVLGAGGGTGAALVTELLARGATVRAVSRTAVAARPGLEVVAADLTDPAQVGAAVDGAAVVFHAAQPAYHRWPTDFPPITSAVVAATTAVGAKLVVADNLYAYGPQGAGPLTEDSPQRATDRKGAFRRAMAEELLAAHRAGVLRVALGRSANYFGPGGTNTVLGDAVFGTAASGRPVVWFGDPDVPRTSHHLPDIARGLLTLAHDDRADGRAWHLPAAPAATGREILALLEQATGRSLQLQVLDLPTVTHFAGDDPLMAEIADIWHQYGQPFTAGDAAFQQTFGPQPATPLAEAIAATTAWFTARAAGPAGR